VNQAETAPRLSDWGEQFSCYSAALATRLIRDRPRWWRPLLADGPMLAVTRQPTGAWRFDHAPRPWVPELGLRIQSSDDWATARAALEAALEAGPPVVVAGDVFNLPWQHGYRRRHASHWVAIQRCGDALSLDDPLTFLTEDGPQAAYRATLTLDELASLAQALPAGDEIGWLRERSVIGEGDLGEGRMYRWLAASDDGWQPPEQVDERLVGPDALEAVADDLLSARGDAPILRQLDDLWQALRHRELAVKVAARDPDFFGGSDVAARHWQEAVEIWRQVPILMRYAQMQSAAGIARAGEQVAEALLRLTAWEGRNLSLPPS
jgi:hypothetical protein